MALYKCKACGGDIRPNEDSFTGKCEYCGTIQTLPKDKDEKISQLLNRANDLRLNSDFNRAIFEYEKVLEIDETEPEAHWGIFLSRYGVEYVKDTMTFTYKPTLHRISSISVYDDVDYQATLKYCSLVAAEQYKKDAENIEQVMKELLLLSANQEPYDIFLSYKEADDITRQRTDDSYLAHDLYNELTAQGYKVFFAPKSLGVGLYEPKIYSAIISSKVMIVLGTQAKYYDAVWVKNEWSRFSELIEKGENKVLIPVYKKMRAEELPNRLAKYQAYDMASMSFLASLLDAISKSVGKESKIDFNKNASAEVAFIERGFIALEDREFSKADSFFENALNLNPHSSQAYFGKLMVEMRVSKKEQILTASQPLKMYKNFEKAVRFADQQQKTVLLQYEEKVQDAVNLAKYNNLKKQIENTNAASEWRILAEKFNENSVVNNSKELGEKCALKADLLEKKLSLEETIAEDKESKNNLVENNGINCNWYIIRGVGTFIGATGWFGVIVTLVLSFLTFAVYIYALIMECDFNVTEWSNYLFSSGSSADYIVFILGSVIPFILLLAILELVFAIIKRIFFNNNSKISALTRKISEDNKKLNDIENEINSISF